MKIPSCYILNKKATLDFPGLQGFKLNDDFQIFDLPATVGQIYAVALHLNPEKSLRHQPSNGKTHCDCLASDFAAGFGCFLPGGVFWNDEYIEQKNKINSGYWFPVYGKTVHELSANDLYDWLNSPYAKMFGWEKANGVTKLQDIANQGYLCCISGKNNLPKGHGHISIVLPENKEKGMIAQRIEGKVFCPIICQAGAICYNWTNENSWFLSKQFKGTHGFYFNRGINE